MIRHGLAPIARARLDAHRYDLPLELWALKGLSRLGLCLKVGEGRRQARVTHLHFEREPRLVVFYQEKILFAFLLIAYVAQLEFAKSEVVPAIDRLEQMAGDQSLRPRPVVCESAPAPQEPIRFFAPSFGYIRKPRANRASVCRRASKSTQRFTVSTETWISQARLD